MKPTTLIFLTLLTPLILASHIPNTALITRQTSQNSTETTTTCEPLSFTFIPSEGAECPTDKIGSLVTFKIAANCQEAIYEITVCRKEATNRLRFAVIKLEACVREQLAPCANRSNLRQCSSRRLANCTSKFISA